MMPAKGNNPVSDVQWILFSPQAMEATLESLCRLAGFFREHGSGLREVAKNFIISVRDAAERRGTDQAFDHHDDVEDWQEHVRLLEVEMGKLRNLCNKASSRHSRFAKLPDAMSSAVVVLRDAVTKHQELAASRLVLSESLRKSEGQTLGRVDDSTQGERHSRMSDIFAQFADEVTSMLAGTESFGKDTPADPVTDAQTRPDSSTIPAPGQGYDYGEEIGSPPIRNFSVPLYSPRAYSDGW